MNQNLFKAIIACGIVCFIACTTTKKAETEKLKKLKNHDGDIRMALW